MTHICKHIDNYGHISLVNSGISGVHYKCGSCNSRFETICCLHSHLQIHAGWSSYYFDPYVLTAFPKYGSTDIGSQTELQDKRSVQQTTTASQTEIYMTDIDSMRLMCYNSSSYNYDTTCEPTDFKAKGHKELQNHSNDSRSGIIECLQDSASDNLEPKLIIPQSFDTIEFESHLSLEEFEIKKRESAATVHLDKDTCYKETAVRPNYSGDCNETKLGIQTVNNTQYDKAEKIDTILENLVTKYSESKCTTCEEILKSHESLEKRDDKTLSCHYCKHCDSKFRSTKKLLKHVQDKHSKIRKTYSCLYCENEFLSTIEKSEHLESEHPEIVQAVKKFNGTKETDITTPCDHCGKQFTTAVGLAFHVSSVHLKKRFKCDICGDNLSQKLTLKSHKIEKHHENMRGFDCDLCKKTFAYKFRLKTHMEQMHSNLEEKSYKYICETCGYSAKTKAALKYHITKHDPQRKQYQCCICSYKTFYKCSLTEHIASHQGIRRFVCDVCGDKLTTGKQLKVHMRRHTGELPYQCEICSKRFRTDTAHSRHRDIHLNKMQFKCDYCNKEFVQKTNCTAHMRQHTGEKPYKCDWCGQCFTHNVSRKSHMNKCAYKPTGLNLTCMM